MGQVGGHRRPAACLPPLTAQINTPLGFRVFYPRPPIKGGLSLGASALQGGGAWPPSPQEGFAVARSEGLAAPSRVLILSQLHGPRADGFRFDLDRLSSLAWRGSARGGQGPPRHRRPRGPRSRAQFDRQPQSVLFTVCFLTIFDLPDPFVTRGPFWDHAEATEAAGLHGRRLWLENGTFFMQKQACGSRTGSAPSTELEPQRFLCDF